MSLKGQRLRVLVNERLTAAAQEIFALFERTIAEYEEELCRSKEENKRKQQLLDSFINSQQTEQGTGVQVETREEAGPSSEAAQVKEEPEEMSIKQEEEQVQEFTAVSVKSEDEEQTDNDEDWGRPCSSSAQQTDRGDKKRKAVENLSPFSKFKRSSSSTAVQEKERPFSCSVCEQAFTQKATLRIHMSTHTEEKRDAGFKEERVVTEHERLYSVEKPFACFICGKAFKHIDNYKLHTAGHMGVKPFSCSECGAQFGKKRNAIRHMAVHSGAWPYKCSECDERFVQKRKLVQHLKVHREGKLTTEGSQGQNVQ